MNLFLLTAVPLAAVAAHRWLFPSVRPFSDWRIWTTGAVWSMTALLTAAFFGAWRTFTGNLAGAFFGLTFTDAILVPGGVVAAWVFFRPKRDYWELSLWLTLVFTLAGIRDFAATSRVSDLSELFLVPLDRILLILALPLLVKKALDAAAPMPRWLWVAAATALGLTGPLFQVLSFASWGWVVWVAEAAGIAAALWYRKTGRLIGATSSVQL